RPPRRAPAAAPGPPGPTLPVGGKTAAGGLQSVVRRSRSSNARRATPSVSSLQLRTKFREAAGDPAGDRPGRQFERLADRLVALVAAEEAVEHLAARLADRVETGPD